MGCSDPCVRHSDCAEGTVCHLGQCVIPPDDASEGDARVGETGPVSDGGGSGEGTTQQDATPGKDSAPDAFTSDASTSDAPQSDGATGDATTPDGGGKSG